MQKWKGEVRLQSTEYGLRREGRDVASPRPPWLGGQGEALPLPAGEARERQLGWHAVPTLPEAERKGEPGSGILEGRRMDVTRRTDATQSRPYPRQSGTGNRGAGYMQAARVVSELSIRQMLSAYDSTQCQPYLETVPTLPTGGARPCQRASESPIDGPSPCSRSSRPTRRRPPAWAC